jgi:uncharacterized Zn-finger protein
MYVIVAFSPESRSALFVWETSYLYNVIMYSTTLQVFYILTFMCKTRLLYFARSSVCLSEKRLHCSTHSQRSHHHLVLISSIVHRQEVTRGVQQQRRNDCPRVFIELPISTTNNQIISTNSSNWSPLWN